MLIISILLSEVYVYFCHLEKFCCSTPKEEIHIYDPNHPEKHFVLKEEQVLEVIENENDDIEDPEAVEYFELQNYTMMSNMGGDSKCSMTFKQK